MTDVQAVQLTAVVFDETIYPRAAHYPVTVERYVDALDAGARFPPIVLQAGTSRLLDGRHRWLAHQQAGREEIAAVWHTVPDGVPAKLYAASLSSRHGDRINAADRRALAREMYSAGVKMELVAEQLQVSVGTVHKDAADLFQADRTRRIALACLLRHAGWTQQAIGDHLDETKQNVSNFFSVEKIGQLSEADLREAHGRLPDSVTIDLAEAIEEILYAEEDAAALAELQSYADTGNENAAEVLTEAGHRNNRERLAAFHLRDEAARKAKAAARAEADRRKRDREEAIQRDANRIKAFLTGFDTARMVATGKPNTKTCDEIVAKLTPTQRRRFTAIANAITWPDHAING